MKSGLKSWSAYLCACRSSTWASWVASDFCSICPSFWAVVSESLLGMIFLIRAWGRQNHSVHFVLLANMQYYDSLVIIIWNKKKNSGSVFVVDKIKPDTAEPQMSVAVFHKVHISSQHYKNVAPQRTCLDFAVTLGRKCPVRYATAC